MRFKILTILVMGLLISACTSMAGELLDKGIKGGINLAKFTGDDAGDNVSTRMGFSAGGYLTFDMGENFNLQPEIYFASKGSKHEDSDKGSGSSYSYEYTDETTMTLNYIEVPVLGVFALSPELVLVAGPYVEFFLNGESKDKYDYSYEFYDSYNGVWESDSNSGTETTKIDSKDITSPNYGLVFGLEYNTGSMTIGGRYSMGLNSIWDDKDIDVKHSVIQILLGIPLN